MLAQLRLLHLLSPQLPVGSYSYSQGLEWVVEEGWVSNASELQVWLSELIEGPLAQQDLPILRKLYLAACDADVPAFEYWSQMALALRDTLELRLEERARADAYTRVFAALPIPVDSGYSAALARTPLAAIGLAASQWDIGEHELLTAFAHNWLEAYVINGVKIIPLGQSEGQSVVFALCSTLSIAVETAQSLDESCIGFSTPSVAMASCGHELMHTRIFRS